MKSSVVKLLTVLIVFFSLVMLNQSCKKVKEDAQIKSEIQVTKHPLEDRFLTVPDSMPGTLKKIAAYIKKQKNKSAFIANIISQVGLPAWDKSLLIAKSATLNRGSGTGADSNYVFVPVVPIGTKEVDGALACLVVGDSVDIKFLNEKDYRQYGFENNNAGNGEYLVGLMMYLQHKAFGTTSFVVNDERLVYGNAPHADSTRKALIHFEAFSNTANRQSEKKTGVAALYAEIEICSTETYYGCSNPAHYGQLCGENDKIGYYTINQCQTYTVWLSGGGGAGAGDSYNPPTSGGGGGISGSVSTQTYLQQILGLTEQEAAIFESYPGLGEETYNYINNSDGQFTEMERKALAISHTLLLGTNPEYTDYCAMRYEDNLPLKGKRFPWFRMLSLQDDYPDLASNIQMLKLNAKQAFYLFNSPSINDQIKQFLEANNNSVTAKFRAMVAIEDVMAGKPFSLAPLANQFIIDSLQGYPCAQKLLAVLPSLNNEIASLLSVFVTNKNFNIIFLARNNMGTTDGEMIQAHGTPGVSINIKIAISTDMLNKSTKEYMLATMYHEALHAYLAYERNQLGDSAFYQKYPKIKTYDVVSPNGKRIKKYDLIDDHERFGPLIDKLRNAILSFNRKMPSASLEAIIRMGIIDPSAMTNDQLLLNGYERDATLGNSKGTKCN